MLDPKLLSRIHFDNIIGIHNYNIIIKTQRLSVVLKKKHKMDSHSIRDILKNFLIGANTIVSVSINLWKFNAHYNLQGRKNKFAGFV